MGSIRNLTTCAGAAAAALFAHAVAGQGMIVTCESQNYQNAECPISGGPVALIRQLSTPPGDCIEGRTWGFDSYNNMIWVTGGCRAEFRIGYGRPRPQSGGTVVVCESQNYRNAECPIAGGPVALIRQLSTPPGDCIEGRTWGFNNNTIWVSGGCRAEFRTGYDGGYGHRPPPPMPGMTVICESQNYRNQECEVPGGPVMLFRQLSTPPGDCIEGRTWGFNGSNNTIWVTSGCRGEFRVGGGYAR